MSRRAAEPADEASPTAETIVYRVPPEFLRDKTLEKMLAKRQITWTADMPDNLAFGQRVQKSDEPAVAESLAMKAASPLERKAYTLRVTDEQMASILAELDAKSEQLGKIKMLARDTAASAGPPSEAEGIAVKQQTDAAGAAPALAREKESGSDRPLTIVLEALATPPANADAKP